MEPLFWEICIPICVGLWFIRSLILVEFKALRRDLGLKPLDHNEE